MSFRWSDYEPPNNESSGFKSAEVSLLIDEASSERLLMLNVDIYDSAWAGLSKACQLYAKSPSRRHSDKIDGWNEQVSLAFEDVANLLAPDETITREQMDSIGYLWMGEGVTGDAGFVGSMRSITESRDFRNVAEKHNGKKAFLDFLWKEYLGSDTKEGSLADIAERYNNKLAEDIDTFFGKITKCDGTPPAADILESSPPPLDIFGAQTLGNYAINAVMKLGSKILKPRKHR